MNLEKAKIAERLLRESEVRFRRLFETAQDGILLLDGDTGKITDVNRFLIDLLGYGREAFLGKKLWELGFLKDIAAAKSAYEILQKTGYVRYEDLPLERKDGQHMEVEFISNLYLVGTQRVIQCNIRDISERKRLEHLKDVFISTASHEIRSPIAVLKMGIDNLESIREGKLDDEEGEIFGVLKKSVEKLEKLIADLLDLSRFESGRVGPALQPVKIGALIEEVINSFQSAAEKRGLLLKGEYEKELPELMADPELLGRVLTNLVGNAIRFAKSKVAITVQKGDKDLQVSVIDDGPGIDAEFIPLLFNKFVQICRPKEGAGYKGTGLGLAICREIVKLHGGKIWANCSADLETQFYFIIPLNKKENI